MTQAKRHPSETLVMTINSCNGSSHPKARKVMATPEMLQACGARLRAAQLVAFPTETVYGLGCHALDPEAVKKVFQAKERPFTDPLIVHVAHSQDAFPLWLATSTTTISSSGEPDTTNHGQSQQQQQQQVLRVLCDKFWPGPLTIVAKAAPHVPAILMANTGFVACRCPSHPVARQLIEVAQVPLAAPSANKFGHVSPTRADHVLDDLGQEDVWVLDSDSDLNDNPVSSSHPNCHVGVESTVAKVELTSQINCDDNNGAVTLSVTVLRQGAVSAADLEQCLREAGLRGIVVQRKSTSTAKDTEATVAPGQTLKHYSPRIPSFLVAPTVLTTPSAQYQQPSQELTRLLRNTIVIDFGARLVAWKDFSCQYRDLSVTGDSAVAAQHVFDTLRWAERVDSRATRILFPQITSATTANGNKYSTSVPLELDALTLAIQDRLTRAASGVVLENVTALLALLESTP